MPPRKKPKDGDPEDVAPAKPTMLDRARDLLETYHIQPIPVPKGSKAPILDGWQSLKLTLDDLPRLFANGCNLGGLLGPISGDVVDVDLDCDEAVLLASVFLPPTGAIFGRRQRPGSHRLYRISNGSPNTQRWEHPVRRGQGHKAVFVELRAGGAQTLFPGSVHPSGDVYTWQQHDPPALVEAGDLLECLQNLASACLLAQEWPDQGLRHEAANALIGVLVRAGWDDATIERYVGAVTLAGGDNQWAQRGGANIRTTRGHVEKNERATGRPRLMAVVGARVVKVALSWMQVRESYRHSDYGNAERLVAAHGDDLRYCAPVEKWYVWAGTRWQEDELLGVNQCAKATVREIYADAALENDPDKRMALVKWALKSESAGKLSAMVGLAQDEPGIPIRPRDWNAKATVLNCQNGTLDLEKLVLQGHVKEDLLSYVAGAPYDPEARDARWDAFLDSALPDPDLRSWVQKAVGYTATGSTREKKFFFCYGPTDAGKTTFLEAIRAALGDYAIGTAFSTWLIQRAEGVRNDLAKLAGRRIIISVEASKDKTINSELVKDFTGGDTITARFLFHEDFDFVPQGTLWWAANDQPRIRDDDEAFWNRMRTIPFVVRYSKAQQDADVRAFGCSAKEWFERDLGAKTAVLAWIIEGLRRWQIEGLGECAAVTMATSAYRTSMDLFARFLEERCTLDPALWVRSGAHRGRVSRAELNGAYTHWCRQARVGRPLSERDVAKRLRDAGISEYKHAGERGWDGIELSDLGGGVSVVDFGQN